jgi:hypothetical protein
VHFYEQVAPLIITAIVKTTLEKVIHWRKSAPKKKKTLLCSQVAGRRLTWNEVTGKENAVVH